MAQDTLVAPRNAVSTAIEKLRAFSGAAGSADMKAVMVALDMLGMAYCYLQQDTDANPAWVSD